MLRVFWIGQAVVLICSAAVLGESNVHPDHKYAWGENIGWTNWRDANDTVQGVVVGPTFLFGFIWAANVGWINVGDGSPTDGVHYANTNGLDFGVNIDANGDLFGLAWGENIDWVNFDTASLGEDRARSDACQHRLIGYAWGENVGWIKLAGATHFVAIGPCVFGDYDCDGDVDLNDLSAFASFFGGPVTGAECAAFDSDQDADIDMVDFAVFAANFTGTL